MWKVLGAFAAGVATTVGLQKLTDTDDVCVMVETPNDDTKLVYSYKSFRRVLPSDDASSGEIDDGNEYKKKLSELVKEPEINQ